MSIKKSFFSKSKSSVTFCFSSFFDRNLPHVVFILGTSNDAEADRLVNEMNVLLKDDSYWNLSEKRRAEKKFSLTVVNAFYDSILEETPLDPWEAREEMIPIPSAEKGFTKVMFLGTTGAGKTSLLRHLIGSDPKKDRFPLTSTGKTTISEIEVIIDEGKYEAVVVFFPKNSVDVYIEESVNEACKSFWKKESDEKIAKALLNHTEQRFRLSYLLGNWAKNETLENEDDWNFDSSEEQDETPEEEAYPSQAECDRMQEKLSEYVEKIKAIAESAIEKISEEWRSDVRRLRGEDFELAMIAFEEHLVEDDRYFAIIEDIRAQVLECFNYLKMGKLEKKRKWPERWTFQSKDRQEFVRQIRGFPSNYAKAFGRLLTPLIQGIRVRGPFYNETLANQKGLVFMDGEGLGHGTETVAQVSTRFTSRYAMADVILLVDNAQQPMQAAPLSVIRSVAASGYQEKLFLAFTHFDQVKGDNLPSFQARKDHILVSVKNALSGMKQHIGASAISRLDEHLDTHCFMFGGLDQRKLPKGVTLEMKKLVEACFKACPPSLSLPTRPIYDRTKLLIVLQAANNDFHALWNARLGFPSKSVATQEQWTRIKALTRRIGKMGQEEYKNLLPLADLIKFFIEKISRFLDVPEKWNRSAPSIEEQAQILDTIRKEVHKDLYRFIRDQLIKKERQNWSKAFEYRGKGSTSVRREDVQKIYQTVAPIFDSEMEKNAWKFLKSVCGAINKAGGEVE